MRHKAECTDAISQAHQDNALLRQVRAVVQGERGATDGKTSAIDPDHYRQAVFGGFSWRPDVEVEAIFARLDGVHPQLAENDRDLHARRRELVRLADSGPGDRRVRRAPP